MSIRLEVPPAAHHEWLAKRFADKEFADARFVVIENEGRRREFLAHKVVLASVSDVFKAMFYGNFPEEDAIKVEDTTVEAFDALLEFIYTGVVTVDADDVFPLLYLAKKYLLGNLKSLVLKYLSSSVDETNVAQLVLHGQNYLDDAPETFWSRIEEDARSLVESEEFFLLKKPTLIDLLRRNLEVEEKTIFERVVAWAQAECERNDLALTAVNMRAVLEGIIRLIRFPLMSSEEFTLGPARSGLLTHEELMDIFPWFTAKLTPTCFYTAERCHNLPAYVCDRLPSKSLLNWHCDGNTDAIEFIVDRSITIIGVGLGGVSRPGCAEFKVSVELRVNDKVQAREVTTITSKGSERIMAIYFTKPLKVSANSLCTVAANISGPPTRRGNGGTASRVVQTRKGAVTFSFSESGLSTNSTNVELGQIPQIMFKV